MSYFIFICQFFLLISNSACFSMRLCFKRLIIHFIINTFRIFYIKFHHRSIVFYLFSSKFFRVCVLFISNGVWGAGFALKLSKFFNYQGLINKNIEQLSLNPRELQSFFRQKRKHQFLECSYDCKLRMVIGSE